MAHEVVRAAAPPHAISGPHRRPSELVPPQRNGSSTSVGQKAIGRQYGDARPSGTRYANALPVHFPPHKGSGCLAETRRSPVSLPSPSAVFTRFSRESLRGQGSSRLRSHNAERFLARHFTVDRPSDTLQTCAAELRVGQSLPWRREL